MQNYNSDGQMILFSLEADEIPERPPRHKSKTVSLSALISIPYFHLDLSKGHVDLFGCHYWEFRSPWREDGPPLNTGVAPRESVRCDLSNILEYNPDEKYDLSKKACLGILRRAKERDKLLPEQLEWALMVQTGLIPMDFRITEMKAYHINQRDEGIDLHGVSGALMATSNMQMQTFITGEAIGVDGYNGDLTEQVAATLGTNCGMSTGRNGVMLPPAAVVAFAANQRDEVRDLHDLSGALQAQPGMKQQTFIAGFSAGAGAKAGSIGYSETLSPTLKGTAGGNCMPSVLCLNDQGGRVMDCTEDVTGTLRAQEHGHQPLVYENHGIDARYTGPHTVAPTLSARAGTGGNNLPLVEQETPEVFCITGNAIDRKPLNGGNGIGYQEDIAFTLTATDRHAICGSYQDTVGALCRGDEKGVGNQYVSQDKLILSSGKPDKCTEKAPRLIRRLTPLECERLQGFPDGWTDLPGASDSARYKALGNSVAIPCVEFIMWGICAAVLYG